VRKIAIAAVVLLLVLAGLAGFTWYWTVDRPVTSYTGTVAAAVQDRVTVYRDRYGVPHIVAQNEHDLYFVQGYLMAQDRLFQMDLTRRAVTGTLSEIFGKDFLEKDKFLRTMGFYRTAQAAVPALSPEERQILQAYADGVNFYIDTHLSDLPVEFSVLRYRPGHWEIADSLAIGKYMAWTLGGNMDQELFMLAAAKILGPEKALSLAPVYPTTAPTIITETERLAFPPPASPAAVDTSQAYASTAGAGTAAWVDNLHVDKAQAEAMLNLAALVQSVRGLGGPLTDLGSNDWVVSGSRTASGLPILANDMHLQLGVPSIWYQQQLTIPGSLAVTGVMFPGVPGVIVGHNDRIAWGVTNVNPDVQDLYIEKPNPGHAYQFEYDGHWEDARVIHEKIPVKGQKDPVPFDIVITRHGPIISGVEPGVDVPLALRWTALDQTDEVAAVIGMDKARNWQEFEAALRHFMVPAQNFVYADVDGHIAYRANGLIPIRKNGNGLMPVPGWVSDYEWEGYIPWSELPQVFDPARGYIVTANQKVIDDSYPYFLTQEWAPPYRAIEITRRLTAKTGLTTKDMTAIQNDWYNQEAARLLPSWLVAIKPASPQDNQAYEALQQYARDPEDTPDSVGASLFHVLYNEALAATFHDEMGDSLYKQFLASGSPVNVFDNLPEDSPWFDDVTTPQKETRADILQKAFQKTVEDLDRQYGPDLARWTWGRLHTITFAHPLGSVKPLDRLFNVGPFAYGGSNATPGAASYQLGGDFAIESGAPWRYTVDMADLAHALDVEATGVSGQPRSPHYRDQVQMWLHGQYKTMTFDLGEVQKDPGTVTEQFVPR